MKTVLNDVKAIVAKTTSLKVSCATDTSIRIENSRMYWRKGFEKQIGPVIELNGLDLLYTTSFGGYDYLIVKKGSL